MTTEKTDDAAVDMQAMMTAASEGEETDVPEEGEDVVEEPEEPEVPEEPDEPEEPEAPEEPEDNRERSKLGRKVEALWKRIDERSELDEKLANVLEAMLAKEQQEKEDENSELLITASQAEKLAEKKFRELQERESKEQSKY